jgi:hypothetical protein
MSSEIVKQFLEKKESDEELRKNKELAQLRHNVLSHYNLGTIQYFDGNGDKNDYPLINSEGKRFRYDCEISDEDFEKIRRIYDKENPNSENEINEGAEKTLNACSIIVLIIGIISFIALWVNSYEEHYELYRSVSTFNWNTFGLGAGILFVSIINMAFSRVIVNISRKLNKLGK